MVSKRRLEFGFNGYQIPPVPRGPRSLKTRGLHQRKGLHGKLDEGGQICAFEILAAVAGKLLQESESSSSSNVAEGRDQVVRRDDIKQRRLEDEKTSKSECLDQASCVETSLMQEISPQKSNFMLLQTENGSIVEHTFQNSSSDPLKNVDSDLKLEICENKSTDESFTCKVGGESTNLENLCDGKMENESQRRSEEEKKMTENSITANTCIVDNECVEVVNTNGLINSKTSVNLPLYRDPVPSASPRKPRNNVKIDVRDDDENYFPYVRSSFKIRAFRSKSLSGYRRVRKMLASRHCKVAPRLKDFEFFKIDERTKPGLCNKRSPCSRQRYQQEVPFKRRKVCGHSHGGASDEEASSESISNSPSNGPALIFHRAMGPSGSMKSKQISRNSNVKLSITSFKVPELYVEVPETATVGSLKRRVMDAVTAILEGGLRVGLVHQGKKVRDDNRTLEQAGISQSGNLDSLGFILEPSFTNISPAVSPNDPSSLLSCKVDQHSPRSPVHGIRDSVFSNAPSDPCPVTLPEKHIETEDELISLEKASDDALTDGREPDRKALVPVANMNVEPLSVVPANQKPKRSEISQRRTRRPFSVAEVEALVEAVEKLGTGRWRDVKMRAFDNAYHRTYVDLKDKWKTLVHTASISPQQRRGEPVPQELLDRVLSAHAYWSQHQPKPHGKHQPEPPRITDAPMQKVVA